MTGVGGDKDEEGQRAKSRGGGSIIITIHNAVISSMITMITMITIINIIINIIIIGAEEAEAGGRDVLTRSACRLGDLTARDRGS